MLRKSYHPYLKVARIDRFGAAQRTVYDLEPVLWSFDDLETSL